MSPSKCHLFYQITAAAWQKALGRHSGKAKGISILKNCGEKSLKGGGEKKGFASISAQL